MGRMLVSTIHDPAPTIRICNALRCDQGCWGVVPVLAACVLIQLEGVLSSLNLVPEGSRRVPYQCYPVAGCPDLSPDLLKVVL